MKSKIPALGVALALLGSAGAFANSGHDGGSAPASADGAMHRLATDLKGAFHKIGAATRHALHRADASLHRGSSKGSDSTRS